MLCLMGADVERQNIHTYIHTYIHTQTHTHTHTHTYFMDPTSVQ